ncbi:hypothetical protein FOA52_004359 [Chlamydomonas sp. UWO 241]|nr:hypothetical protein FOA52_004359 [Chlamydomonas sp. UWO 241]
MRAGFTADELKSALLRWPGVRFLALLGVSDASNPVPLATASLTGLKSLTVRERTPALGLLVAPVSPWGLLELSSSVAAPLQVVDVSCCASLASIDAVRSCAQLRCLRMVGGVGVSTLSPLGACGQLEQLWMAAGDQITSLSPLKACPKLCKLDLRGCQPELFRQVEDLQLSCTQLAHPSSVELQGLVHEIQPSMPSGVQQGTARSLGLWANTAQKRSAVAAAGAIHPLVQLLGQRSTAEVHAAAAGTLDTLAAGDAANVAAITAAGAIPQLVQLLGQHSTAEK